MLNALISTLMCDFVCLVSSSHFKSKCNLFFLPLGTSGIRKMAPTEVIMSDGVTECA